MKKFHVIFISDKNEWYKNDELLKNKNIISKWRDTVYEHIDEVSFVNECNLYIIFGKSLLNKIFPNKKIGEFFSDNKKRYYSIENYKHYDTFNKREFKSEMKCIRNELNDFFSRFALIKVNKKDFYYRDLDFKKIREINRYEKDSFYVEDENGEYLSYDNKKLKKVPDGYFTTNKTYEAHLTSKDLFYYEQYPNIAHSKFISYFSYDIENNLSLDVHNTPEPIVSITGYSNIYNKIYVWVLKKYFHQEVDIERFGKAKIFIFENEENMLIHFLKIMGKLDVDLLGGWNSWSFDDQYLFNRIINLKIDLIQNIFINLYMSKIKVSGNSLKTKYKCNNLIQWDYMEYAKWITFVNAPMSWSLNAAAEHFLKKKKIEHEGIREMWENDLNKLIEYNIRDVELTEELNKKLKLTEFPMLYQTICPQDYENVFSNSKTVENMLHYKFKQYKFPTKEYVDSEKFKGALVTEPVAGVYENVAVLDYASLYPNIMITFNISKETIVEDEEFNPMTMAKLDDVIFRLENKGIIPQLLEDLIGERAKIKKEKKELDRNSMEFKFIDDFESCFKALINSVYGVMGFKGFILYDKRAAKSVTFIDREILQFTIDKGEEFGYKNLYSDTDSVVGDSIININGNRYKIKDFYDNSHGVTKITGTNKYMKYLISDYKTLCVDKNESLCNNTVKYIMKHRVKKRMFRLKVGDKHVDVTEDHSIIVRRNGCILSVTPMDILKSDELIIVDSV